ncbi:hypothetical protein UlMin_014079 [Ulmus minor]
MVFLKKQNPTLKRPSSSTPPFPPPKIPKSTAANAPPNDVVGAPAADEMVKILAEAGCTLINPSGPPCVPSDPHKFRRQLQHLFSFSDNAPVLRSNFLAGLSSYILSQKNFRRILAPSKSEGFGSSSESLVRHLLLVPSLQIDLQNMLLEKLPEYFHVYPECSGTSLSLEDDVARLIINHFRWLDFIVDPNAFTDKLMQVLSICPLHLKKEIIGSLPEIIGDQNNKTVISSLEQMLEDDSAIVVPVLDSFSNLHLDDQLQEQVITIALSCIRTIDVEHMPFLLRFLLISATPTNVGRIISKIREQLKFVGLSNSQAMQQRKLKGKSQVDSSEVEILDALRTSLRFKNMLCQEILKELSSVQKPQDHKVIDIWLLILIYMNGESLQKRVETMFKKKSVEDCFQEAMFDQCICGHRELVRDYFPSFISLSEYMLGCKEQKARKFGIHMYITQFEEFSDSYSRQEVLGSLVTLVGSGVGYTVSSALETMGFLASKFARELIPLSSHISGILDYLEGFNVENLHKVYEVFSQLALFARSSTDSYRSSFANELLMIVRKQVGHPDLKFKKMGLIGALKIVSCLGDANNVSCPSLSPKSNSEEALELLKMSLESCKQFPLSLVMFYDELTELMNTKTLHPTIFEWVGNHVGEFESMFLADLDGGQLPVKESNCGLEGELWMNLDGDISPICLNIFALVSSSSQSTSLQVLPANFLLLSAIERLTNQGSLGGIDALLGCPLHLPSSKYFFGAGWKSLTGKQKQVLCLSLYYAANWIRELLNAFCTQVAGGFQFTSQATKVETITKLLKRLRNLVFLESLLNYSVEKCSLSLPELHLYLDHSGSSMSNQPHHARHVEKKNEPKKTNDNTFSDNKRTHKKLSRASKNSDSDDKLRQPKIKDVLRKSGVIKSQDEPENSSDLSSKSRSSESSEQHPYDSSDPVVEISAVAKSLEAQRSKFRHLLVQCFSLLTFSNSQDSCCSDPAAEIPLFLYLLRDLHHKLDYFTLSSKLFFARCSTAPIGFTRMTLDGFLTEIKPVFPSLKRHLDTAVSLLKEGDETCQEHWKTQSASAANPDIPIFALSKSVVSTLVFKEILHCFREITNIPDSQMDKAILSCFLDAFQPVKIPDNFLSGMQLNLPPGTLEHLYIGVYSFVEGVLNEACSFSFMLASESLFTLESIVTSLRKLLDKLKEGNGNQMRLGFTQRALPILCIKLGTSAEKLLRQRWDTENLENSWRNKGEIVQKILRVYLENNDSTSALLDDIACSIMPQALSCRSIEEEEDDHGFPTLTSATFIVWYRVLHEQNLSVLNRVVKSVSLLGKHRAGAQHETVEELLVKLQQSVNVVVSLASLCRNSDKVTVHAMAVKYGGKFVDSFLKVFDFLRAQFEGHRESVIQMVKELQKATRTIQTLCSEAKGLKQTAITSKIPATKRSMERFLFHVKALLHTTSSGCTFWMGNLKHKDLMGQVVSSQAYMDDQDDDGLENPTEAANENSPVSVASEDDGETEL